MAKQFLTSGQDALERLLVCAVLVFSFTVPLLAQGIVLKPADVLGPLNEEAGNVQVFYLNGLDTHGLEIFGDRPVETGSFSKTLLALLTLRLVDQGTISLDTTVSDLLPDVVPEDAFQAAITIRHLLQEIAGFATPPLSLEHRQLRAPYTDDQLRRFAIRQRSPAQLSTHDPVGWAVLIRALESASGRTLADLLIDEIQTPLAINDQALVVRQWSFAATSMPVKATLTTGALATVARLLIRNRDRANQLFLSRASYQAMISGAAAFRLHPDANPASLGLRLKGGGKQRWMEPLNAQCDEPFGLTAFPREGVVFIGIGPGPCTPVSVRAVSLEQASAFFPGRPLPQTDGPPLARPSKLEGRYITAEQSPAALADRLTVMESEAINIFGYNGDEVRFRRTGGMVEIYTQAQAYQFSGQRAGTAPLLFSPFKLGGYLKVGDQTYRRADILGATAPLKSMIPWALLVLATAGCYAASTRPKPWRRMGQFALAGSLLVATGLYAEMHFWPAVLYEMGQPWLITLWRFGLNIGLMLVLSLPMFVLSFARKKTIPTQGAAILIAPHLVAVAVSALVVFFTLVLWGVAGTFSPY